MTHHRYIGIIGIAGLLSWTAFLIVLFKLNPLESPGLSLGLFFTTLFLALMSTFSILGFYFRLYLNHNEIYYHHINISLRQGILLSALAILALAFQLVRVLTWWTGFLLVFAVLLIEFYFLLREKR